MLSMTTYPKDYIDGCQAKIDRQVAAYKRLRAGTGDDAAGTGFDHVFFNNMVLVLDAYFVHRARALELKDGNPLNEVRVMCNSMMSNDDFEPDRLIRPGEFPVHHEGEGQPVCLDDCRERLQAGLEFVYRTAGPEVEAWLRLEQARNMKLNSPAPRTDFAKTRVSPSSPTIRTAPTSACPSHTAVKAAMF